MTGEKVPDKATRDDVEGALARVADDVRNWKAGHGRGVDPGGFLMKWANEMFEAPKVNASVLLNKLVRQAVTAARGHSLRKWGKPSRLRGILSRAGWGDEAPLFPVWRGPRPRVVLVLDRSFSMGWGKGSRAARATNEALGFVRAAQGDAFGLAVNVEVQAAVPVRTADDLLKLNIGGGGTDMRVGVRSAMDKKLHADVIVLITDGETPWPAPHEMPKCPMVTLVVNEKRGYGEHVWASVPRHIKAHAVFVGTNEEAS